MKKWIIGMRYLAWGLAGASLLWFLIALIWLKSPIGVHFAGDGSFDVFDSKFYGFYPHVINLLCIGLTELADRLTDKVKTGLRVTERGEALLRTVMHISIGWGRLLVVLFFCYWNLLVIIQKALLPLVPSVIFYLLFGGAFVTILAFVIIRYCIAGKGRTDA